MCLLRTKRSLNNRPIEGDLKEHIFKNALWKSPEGVFKCIFLVEVFRCSKCRILKDYLKNEDVEGFSGINRILLRGILLRRIQGDVMKTTSIENRNIWPLEIDYRILPLSRVRFFIRRGRRFSYICELYGLSQEGLLCEEDRL